MSTPAPITDPSVLARIYALSPSTTPRAGIPTPTILSAQQKLEAEQNAYRAEINAQRLAYGGGPALPMISPMFSPAPAPVPVAIKKERTMGLDLSTVVQGVSNIASAVGLPLPPAVLDIAKAVAPIAQGIGGAIPLPAAVIAPQLTAGAKLAGLIGGSPSSSQWPEAMPAGGPPAAFRTTSSFGAGSRAGLIPFSGAASYPGPGWTVHYLPARRPAAGHEAGYFWKKRRHMNPLNFHALKKGMHRVQSFARIARSAITFTHHVKMKKHFHRRRSRKK